MEWKNQTEEHRKYLELLAREFPTQEATVTDSEQQLGCHPGKI